MSETQAEYTGGSVSYYKVDVKLPTSGGTPYTAECNDVIEALGMNYAEGNAFKAIWRRCAARTLGKFKAGYTDGKYDAEKVVFYGQRMVAQSEEGLYVEREIKRVNSQAQASIRGQLPAQSAGAKRSDAEADCFQPDDFDPNY